MYDLNFFAATKRQGPQNRAFSIFLLVLILVLVILNAVLIGGGLYVFGQMQAELDAKQNQINDLVLQEQIAEAGKIRAEAELVAEYLDLLQNAGEQLELLKLLDSGLLDRIRRLTPEGVSFSSLVVSGRQVSVNCQAEALEDALDFYHAFAQDPVFVNVSLGAISVQPETQQAGFSLTFSVKGD